MRWSQAGLLTTAVCSLTAAYNQDMIEVASAYLLARELSEVGAAETTMRSSRKGNDSTEELHLDFQKERKGFALKLRNDSNDSNEIAYSSWRLLKNEPNEKKKKNFSARRDFDAIFKRQDYSISVRAMEQQVRECWRKTQTGRIFGP